MFRVLVLLVIGCAPLTAFNMKMSVEQPYSFKQRSLSDVKTIAGGMAFFTAARSANAFKFEPIERDQMPDKSSAAIVINGALPEYSAVRKDIDAVIKERPSKGPTLVRLAWHSSGTYDKMKKNGGSNGGTIRFKEELGHGANAGLDTAMSWLEPIYKKYNKASDLSYADLYTLAGAQAIESLGGPHIDWRAGRVDYDDESLAIPDGRLPDADKGSPSKTAQHLRDIFSRMGFNDQELVALAGAHALGRCHPTSSGYEGPWSPTPVTFNNAYYTLLLNIKWEIDPKKGKLQYKDPSGKLMMLPSDLVLIEDPSFRQYVVKYSKDQKAFRNDFASAFSRLLELGTTDLISV